MRGIRAFSSAAYKEFSAENDAKLCNKIYIGKRNPARLPMQFKPVSFVLCSERIGYFLSKKPGGTNMKTFVNVPKGKTRVVGVNLLQGNKGYLAGNCSNPAEARDLVQKLNNGRTCPTDDIFYIPNEQPFFIDGETTH